MESNDSVNLAIQRNRTYATLLNKSVFVKVKPLTFSGQTHKLEKYNQVSILSNAQVLLIT